MIKGLRKSIAETGKIKIGGKGDPRPVQGGDGRMWAPPRKDDHFTITTNMREGGDPNANLITNEVIMAALVDNGFADPDGKVRRLPVMLLHDEIDQVFPTAYVAYAGKHMACKGDGETALRYIDGQGEVLATPAKVDCPCERLEKDNKGGRRCKFNGILHCTLRLPGHAVIGSVYRWRTTSEISVQQIVTHLGDILAIAGALRGLPLLLVLRPQQVSPGGRASTVYVCHIDLCEDLVIAQRSALDAAQMRRELAGNLLDERDAYRAPLQLPGAEDATEQEAIAGEYYPEVVGTTPAGAQVQSAPPSGLLDSPLSGFAPPVSVTTDADAAAGFMGAPVPPAAPPPAAATRTRKTKCTVCGEMFGAGIVKKGMCTECRKPQTPPAAQPDPAPEIGHGPPVPPARPEGATVAPYPRIQAAFRAACRPGGASKEAVLAAMMAVWPDTSSRRPTDWTDDDATQAEAVLGNL